MKKLYLVLLLATCCISALAQKVSGTFQPLKDAGRVKMVVDFSQADIMSMSEEEFAVYEEDWEKDKPELLSRFYSYANKRLKNALVLGNYTADTDYELTLCIKTVDLKGNYDCDLILSADGTEIGRAIGIRAKGGTFGSKLNLMKDGAEHTGEAMGKFLLKAMNY